MKSKRILILLILSVSSILQAQISSTITPQISSDLNGDIKVSTSGGSWISGKTGTGGINGSGQTISSYHPFLRQTTSSGHVVNIGGLRDFFGIYGYNKNRTENGYDYSLIMDLTTGNVGIGLENGKAPSSKLEVNGNIQTNSITLYSDIRLKKNVSPIHNATASILALQPVSYQWNKLGKKRGGNKELQYGFIAQEVKEILPSLINTGKDGYESVNYIAIIPFLVKALQEKDREVKQLKEEIESIKQTIGKVKE